MSIEVANSSHHEQIEHLLAAARLRYVNQPVDDMRVITDRWVSVVGLTEARVWGLVSIELEERPDTLDPTEPSRVYLRAVALARGRGRITDTGQLLAGLADSLRERTLTTPHPIQICYFSDDDWLYKPLQEAGFYQHVEVAHYELRSVQRQEFFAQQYIPSDVELGLIHPQEIDPLAQLDRVAFEPIWHFGSDQLRNLMMDHRIVVAREAGTSRLVGYSAYAISDGKSSHLKAHLARLAVTPQYQQRGIARALLHECLDHAKEQNIRSMGLNTQVDNNASIRLYRSIGFSRTGSKTPLWIWRIE